MKGELFINGKDAFLTWGIYLDSAGLSALLTPAPNKEPVTDSSRIRNGVDVISSDPKKDSREVNLPINLSANSRGDFFLKYASFCEELDKEVITINVSYLPSTYFKFRYRNCQQFSEFKLEVAQFILRLTEYNPADRSK